jgi:hypothetical protein
MRRMSSRFLPLVLLSARIALAEKSSDYVAPGVFVRFARSFVFLGVAGGAVALLLFLIQRWIHRANITRERRIRYWLLFAVLVLTGALFAAGDEMNDEHWNPPFSGTFALAPLLAIAILVLTPARPAAVEWITAIGLAPFFFFGMRYVLFFAQYAGFDLSW